MGKQNKLSDNDTVRHVTRHSSGTQAPVDIQFRLRNLPFPGLLQLRHPLDHPSGNQSCLPKLTQSDRSATGRIPTFSKSMLSRAFEAVCHVNP
jgi:hypothetical protein